MRKQTQSSSNPSLLPLIKQAREGDKNAFEALLCRYTPLIDSMVHRLGSNSFSAEDREDLRQEALVGFFRALTHFDVEQTEVQFGLYAKLCIKNAIYSQLRKWNARVQYLSLDDENLALSEDTESNPSARVMEQEHYLELARLIKDALSEYENKIWWLYLSGRTAKEIARGLGKDERSVQNAIYRIRKKLRMVIPRP